jgi:hypothetical protein
MIAGRFSPGLRSFGRNSWFGTSRPSAAFVITACGSTWRSSGNFFSDAAVGNTYCCVASIDDSGGLSFHTPMDCGRFQSALWVASSLPEASGVGHVSIPLPDVAGYGVPPETGTAQMWRRSMSFAFVQ